MHTDEVYAKPLFNSR